MMIGPVFNPLGPVPQCLMTPGSPSDSTPGDSARPSREVFSSRWTLLLTMIGVAVGLGNVWRFPYMVGQFGGAPFVLFYLLAVVTIGIPALMAEWILGRRTRRGPVGAFARSGLPGGRWWGWFFFLVVTAATGYYTNALGWVLHYAVGEVARLFGQAWPSAAILPPASGFELGSFLRQVIASGCILIVAGAVVGRGLRSGIEKASRVLMPFLAFSIAVILIRTLSLPGAWAGVEWYILKLDLAALTPRVMAAAMGQAVFSLSLGGTFMVVYGSHLADEEPLAQNALWTSLGDLFAGLLAGLAILPAVIALGLQVDQGPGLIFSTLPKVFAQLPGGGLFGALFFLGLLGAAFLSSVAALEVLVAGVTDNTSLPRSKAVKLVGILVFFAALPSMTSMEVFGPWDLLFGSGMQTLGALLAVLTVAWCFDRSRVLADLGGEDRRAVRWLYTWLRYVVPSAIFFVGIWWFLSDVLGVVSGA